MLSSNLSEEQKQKAQEITFKNILDQSGDYLTRLYSADLYSS